MSSGGRQKARMRTEPSIASSSRVTASPRGARPRLELPQARADPRYRLEIGVLVGRSDDGVFLAGHFDEEPPQSPRVRSEVKAHPVFGLVEQDFVHRLPRRDGRGDETGEGVQEEVFAVCPSGVHRRFAHSRQLCNLREVEAVPADVSVEPQARFEDAPVGAAFLGRPTLFRCAAPMLVIRPPWPCGSECANSGPVLTSPFHHTRFPSLRRTADAGGQRRCGQGRRRPVLLLDGPIRASSLERRSAVGMRSPFRCPWSRNSRGRQCSVVSICAFSFLRTLMRRSRFGLSSSETGVGSVRRLRPQATGAHSARCGMLGRGRHALANNRERLK